MIIKHGQQVCAQQSKRVRARGKSKRTHCPDTEHGVSQADTQRPVTAKEDTSSRSEVAVLWRVQINPQHDLKAVILEHPLGLELQVLSADKLVQSHVFGNDGVQVGEERQVHDAAR